MWPQADEAASRTGRGMICPLEPLKEPAQLTHFRLQNCERIHCGVLSRYVLFLL